MPEQLADPRPAERRVARHVEDDRGAGHPPAGRGGARAAAAAGRSPRRPSASAAAPGGPSRSSPAWWSGWSGGKASMYASSRSAGGQPAAGPMRTPSGVGTGSRGAAGSHVMSVDRRRSVAPPASSRSPSGAVVSTTCPRRRAPRSRRRPRARRPGAAASSSASGRPSRVPGRIGRDLPARRRRAGPRARSCPVAQQRAAHLAARGLRQVVGELDDARVLVGRRLLLDVVLQLARRAPATPSWPSRSTTTARTTEPRSASGAATAAASATAGCETSADSTSNGPIR